jgi:hypothetical protein
MQRVKVTSIQHLKELLEQGENEFVVTNGLFRSSKFINHSCEVDGIFILHEIDDSEENITWAELEKSNNYLNEKIAKGMLYCEIW